MMSLAQITLPDMKNFQNLLPMVFSHDRKSTIGYCRFSSNNRVTPSGPKARRYKGCAGKCLQAVGRSAWALMKTLLERAFLALICCQHYAR